MSAPTKEVQLYARGRVSRHGHTDGHWSCHLQFGRYHCRQLSGDVPSHSPHRMELMGIIAGLKALKYPCLVQLKTANEYISDCGERLLHPKSSDLFVGAVHRGTAKNADLWQQIKEMNKIHRIRITAGTATALRREVESARYWAAHGPFIQTRE
jgi:ribonuclease HI